MSISPTNAVIPGMPRTPIAVEIGTAFGSILRSSLPFDRPCVCHPSYPVTKSPVANPGLRDSTTSLTVWPTMTPPTLTGVAYEGASLIRPRMYGSRER